MNAFEWKGRFAVGDSVWHPKHGSGIVREILDYGWRVRFGKRLLVIQAGDSSMGRDRRMLPPRKDRLWKGGGE